jgi:hypothetical protein
MGTMATWPTPGNIKQQWRSQYDSRCADVKRMQVQEIFAELWRDSLTSAPRRVMTSHADQNQRLRRGQGRKAKISKKSGIAVGGVEIFPNIRLPMGKVSLWIQLSGLALVAVIGSWEKCCIWLESIICLILSSVLLYECRENR